MVLSRQLADKCILAFDKKTTLTLISEMIYKNNETLKTNYKVFLFWYTYTPFS